MTNAITSREDWLNAFTQAARPVFAAVGFPFPDKVRVSIGFPSTGRKSKRIGECWHDSASEDAHFEIFMHPGLQSDSSRIADILTHELCHTATPGDGHGKQFKACATGMGLVGKMRSTTAGPKWFEWAAPILDDLGELPGANLTGASLTGPKKQKTNLLKQTCTDCGLTMRITAKWLNECGELRCPDKLCDGVMYGE